MKKNLLLLFLLINLYRASAQNASDFSFNMVRMTDGKHGEDAPAYGFITGKEKNGDRFYFVMIYPKNMQPLQEINVAYKTEEIGKDLLRSARASLTPYDGIVIIGDYRIVVYEASGRTTIRNKYVLDPTLTNRDRHKIYIDRRPDDDTFTPDIYDTFVEMNERNFTSDKDEPISFKLSRPIPGLITAGYPVVDIDGYFNGLIASPKSNSEFDVITTFVLKKKLADMTDDGYLCKYFNLVYKDFDTNDCDNPDLIIKNEKLAQAAKKRHDIARKQNINHPIAIGLKAGASGQYTNVGGTVSPGNGFNAGIDFHFFPDSGIIGLSVRPRYAIYNYDPHYRTNFPSNNSNIVDYGEYNVTLAHRRQIDLQFFAEVKFNRRLHGHNYLGFGYSTSFTKQKDFRLIAPDGNTVDYMLPTEDDRPDAFLFEVGWATGKMRYAFTATYLRTRPFPQDYSISYKGHLLTPFANTADLHLLLNFDIAFRIWGHWRNGIKG